jgi:4-amino-4-deoxy-L-arabinose transferase-like glycosyltransferase
MVISGDWILMHVNGEAYTDKPPFFFWLIAFCSYVWQGFSSFSVRFPAALLGTVTVLLAYLLAKRFYPWGTGSLSGLILTTSREFTILSTRASIDTVLAFFITASLFCFFRWYPHREEKGNEEQKEEPLPAYGSYVRGSSERIEK